MRTLLLGALLLLPGTLAAQQQENLWTAESIRKELVAGAVVDWATFGPWMDDSWRSSRALRLVVANSVNLLYEYVIEPVNNQTNAARWEDAVQRAAGTLLGEAVVAAGKALFR